MNRAFLIMVLIAVASISAQIPAGVDGEFLRAKRDLAASEEIVKELHRKIGLETSRQSNLFRVVGTMRQQLTDMCAQESKKFVEVPDAKCQ